MTDTINSEVQNINSEQSKDRLQSQDMFEKETMWKLVLKMAVPSVLMFIAMALYTTVDTLLATSLIGSSGIYNDLSSTGSSSDAVLSMIGWSANVISIALGAVVIFNTGAEIRYATQLSKGDYKGARETINSTFSTSIIFSIVLASLLAILAEPIVTSQAGEGQNPEAIKTSAMYIQLQMIYIPFVAIFDIYTRVFRVEGKLGPATLVGVIGIPINLLFDYIFMGAISVNNGDPLGLEGAALASVMGYSVSAFSGSLFALKYKRKNQTNLFYSFSLMKIKSIVFWGSLSIGLPFVLRSVLVSFSNAQFISSVNKLGEFDINLLPPGTIPDPSQIDASFYDSYWSSTAGVFQQSYNIVWMCILGLIQGTSSIVSYNYGSKNYQRTKSATLWILFYMFITSIFFTLLFILLTPQIMSLFSATYIDSLNISFIRQSLIRVITLGLTFVPFAYFLNTSQNSKTYLISILQFLIYFLYLSLFNSSLNLGTNPNYYKVLPYIALISDITIIVIFFPIYFYKLKHIHRDQKLQEIYTEYKSEKYKLNLANKVEISSLYNDLNEVLKKEVSNYQIEINSSNIFFNLIYRGLFKIFSKYKLVNSKYFSEKINSEYKNIKNKKNSLNDNFKKQKNSFKDQKNKKYNQWLNLFKIEKKLFVFNYCYDFQNSKEKEYFKHNQELKLIEKNKNKDRKIRKQKAKDMFNNFDENQKIDYKSKQKQLKQEAKDNKKAALLRSDKVTQNAILKSKKEDAELKRKEKISKFDYIVNLKKSIYLKENQQDKIDDLNNRVEKRSKRINKKYDRKIEKINIKLSEIN